MNRENDIITGEINRIRKGNAFVDMGRLEGILPLNEQIPNEILNVGDQKKMLILEVKKTGKGPQVVLSRSHPNLVKKLFEIEVPEIMDGVVEIAQVSREAGSRSKIAIFSRDKDVDPLGACVGLQGNRVRTVVDELNGEKIDIILWSSDMAEYIKNSLAPSDVTHVIINEDERSSVVFVPGDQLSLAIGKEGQNARLAARLTNWKIDIKSDDTYEEFLREHADELEGLSDEYYANDEHEDVNDDSNDFDDEDYDEYDENEYEEAYKSHYDSGYSDDYSDELYDDYSKYDEELEIDNEYFDDDFHESDEEKGDE